MHRVSLLSFVLVSLSLASAAHAQECSSDGENPMGIAMAFGAATAPLLALPVWATDGHLPRPGSGDLHMGLGYQSDPHTLALAADAGRILGRSSVARARRALRQSGGMHRRRLPRRRGVPRARPTATGRLARVGRRCSSVRASRPRSA
ncbi:MAG: hypothetical protein M5U28_02000 [Sandaracinaceae bacterium]|nr:hypothetical protein [Sandaracinaceae bacterium]